MLVDEPGVAGLLLIGIAWLLLVRRRLAARNVPPADNRRASARSDLTPTGREARR